METLFEQKFTYSGIIPYKNYSTLNQKNDYKLYSNLKCFGDLTFDYHPFKSRSVILRPKKKQNVCYFYSDTQESKEFIVFRKLISSNKKDIKACYHTTKDRHIKNYYNNPFAEIWVSTILRKIKIDGDKIKIQVIKFHKRRDVNSRYFKRYREINIITLNVKTGNFYFTEMRLAAKSKIRKFKQNDYGELCSFLKNISDLRMPDEIYKTEEYKSRFSSIDFYNKIMEVLDVKNVNANMDRNEIVSQVVDSVLQKIMELRKIKVPNSYHNLLIHAYPNEKLLRKNDRKLIASILDRLGIKSKITIKLLHEHPDLSIKQLFSLCCVFGEDYPTYLSKVENIKIICRISSELLTVEDFPCKYTSKTAFLLANQTNKLKRSEKECIVKIINDVSLRTYFNIKQSTVALSTGLITMLDDHIRIIKYLRDFLPKTQIKAKTLKQFFDEHKKLSELYNLVQKGIYVNYIFEDETTKTIEEKITTITNDKSVFECFPKLLTNGNEYVEEGAYMHHCVNTYIEKESSLIVSIRSSDGTDRVTCEFSTDSGDLLQVRHFSNGQCPPYFCAPVEIVQNRVKHLSKNRLLKPLEKKVTNLVINDILINHPEKLNAVFERVPF